MLSFVGLGISGFESIPIEGLETISNADIVYLEQFTSPISESDLKKIQDSINGEFKLAKRWLVEDGNEILEMSKEKNVVLLAYGDPYIATTHIELRARAIENKIKTHSIHASSSLTSMIGECGLHFYKIGRIATIMSEMKSLTTPYYVIYKNLIEGKSIALMIDQRVREGEKVKFFNNLATTTTIPAQLVKKYNCELVPIYIERKKSNYFKIIANNPKKRISSIKFI